MNQKNLKAVFANIDKNLAESFDKYIEDRGYTKYRALQTAIKIYMCLPNDVLSACMESNAKDFYRVLLSAIQSRELTRRIQTMTPDQQALMFDLVKEGTAKLKELDQ